MNDLLLDESGDLSFIDGRLSYGESTEQHQRLLLMCNPGDFKETPSACIGAASWLKDNDVNGLLAAIKSGFEKDGMQVNSVGYNSNTLNITIDAKYKADKASSNPA